MPFFLEENNEVWQWHDCSGFRLGTQGGIPPARPDAVYVALLMFLTSCFPCLEYFPHNCLFLFLMMGLLLRHLRSPRSRSQVLFRVHIIPHPLRRSIHCIICFAHQVTIFWKARAMSHSSFHAQCLAQKPGCNWNSICSCRINRILNETPILSPATWLHIAKLKYLSLHSVGA